jgi:hypothetical protein
MVDSYGHNTYERSINLAYMNIRERKFLFVIYFNTRNCNESLGWTACGVHCTHPSWYKKGRPGYCVETGWLCNHNDTIHATQTDTISSNMEAWRVAVTPGRIGVQRWITLRRMDDWDSNPGRSWDFFSSPPRPVHPPIQWDRGPNREADHLSQSNFEVRNAWSSTSTTQYVFIAWWAINYRLYEDISRDSSVGLALAYGLDDRGSRVRFPPGAGNFSLHPGVRNDSGAHPPSYPTGTRESFSGVKRPGREADHSLPSSAEAKECVELYL